ncbi:UNVERIFIED_CONTAM: hypothetical protein HDU68_010115 [Siphonaria sp. JEL0065]|nr:hypothetical protein HDU68_010115 [Siphonaria sp. JEL0065]
MSSGRLRLLAPHTQFFGVARPLSAFSRLTVPVPVSFVRRVNSTSTLPNSSPHEGLPRWPGPTSATGVLRSLDWFGTAVFAVSGSLTAAASGCDVLGCSLIGTVTAVGGGTLRDALVLRVQPFWVEEWEYLVLSLVSAAAAFFLWGKLERAEDKDDLALKGPDGGEGRLMDWGDAVGVGAFAVIGAMNGIRAQCPALVCALCGMMTATFVGMTRDALLSRPVRILHPYSDTYASIAFVGATSYLAMRAVAPQLQALRIVSCVGFTILLRQQAWTHGWRLPHWDIPSQSVVRSTSDPRIRRS